MDIPSKLERALTLADLEKQSYSEDSSRDLDQSRLQHLGIDISNIQQLDMSKEISKDTTKSFTHFSKKHSDSTTNVDFTNNLVQFKQKIQDLQHEMNSNRSDPYEMSIHSFKQYDESQQLQISDQATYQQKYQQINNKNNTSLSSGGLSFNPPQLNSTNNQQRMDLIGNLSEQLQYHKIKYYDQYLPQDQKLLFNPLKYLKYKIHQQTKYNFEHCLDCLIH